MTPGPPAYMGGEGRRRSRGKGGQGRAGRDMRV